MKLTKEIKRKIDSMSYEELLKHWRFAPIGDPFFTGEVGKYYIKRMEYLRNHSDDETVNVNISKKIVIPPIMREQLAKYAHEAWAGWMKYMLDKAQQNTDGTITIPKWTVEHWKRQMTTTYDDLPEDEKERDRWEADKMIAIIKTIWFQES